MPSPTNPSQRIKGQEVTILIVQDSQLQATLTDIQSFNAEVQLEIKSQGYLGEKTNRKDYIFNGVKFDMELHVHTQDWLNFVQAVINKAQRITPDTVFNITGVFSFPNGDTPTMVIANAAFGPLPVNVNSRGDYVKVKLEGEADNFSAVTS
jgi:hypothetical protein